MKRQSTIIKLMLETPDKQYRQINLGKFPKTKVVEWQRNGDRSRLWKFICQLVREYYQNDKITAVEAEGAVNQIELCSYQVPVHSNGVINVSGRPAVFS